MISFHPLLNALDRQLLDLERQQLPFAVALALNDTAADIISEERREVHRSIDRPTPFTMNAFYQRRATKRRQVAKVGIKDRQVSYLHFQIEGGSRLPKRRAILVPKGARLNRYGNLPRGSVKRALAKKNVFSATIKGQAGIWQRRKRGRRTARPAPKLLVAFIPSANYRPRFDFYGVGIRTAPERFPVHLSRRLVEAMRTAR